MKQCISRAAIERLTQTVKQLLDAARAPLDASAWKVALQPYHPPCHCVAWPAQALASQEGTLSQLWRGEVGPVRTVRCQAGKIQGCCQS